MSFISRKVVRFGRFVVVAAGAALLAVTGSMAQAGTMTFNLSGITDGSSNTAVQTAIQTTVGSLATVTVTGAEGGLDYNGDGHVVGAGNGSVSYNIGNYNIQTSSLYSSGSYTQPFIMNNQGSGYNSFSIAFAKPAGVQGTTYITGISFDFEIFPDANNPAGDPPGFSFGTNTNSDVYSATGVNPGTAGTYSATWTHSPASGSGSTETYPQLLGYYSNLNLGTGVNTLYFNDWPAEIGVNDITIYTYSTPEPASLSLIFAGLGSLGVYRRIKRWKAKA
jgi:hypothetical protein